jgi:predicted GNAT family N-acyltransferase
MAEVSEIFVRQPYTGIPEEMEAIFQLREEVLGEPIKDSRDTEKKYAREASLGRVVNAAAFDNEGNAIAAGRISEDRIGQWMLRYICVKDGYRDNGLGTEIVGYLTHAARQKRAEIIEVKARKGDEDAPKGTDRQRGSVGFYRKLHFRESTPAYQKHGIWHLRMTKKLPELK